MMVSSIEKAAIDFARATQTHKGDAAGRLDDAALLKAPITLLNFDSLEKLEFVMNLEDAFGIALDENDVERCGTLAELTVLVGKAVSTQRPC